MKIPRGVAVAGSMAIAGGLAAALTLSPAGALGSLSSVSAVSPPVSGESPPAALTVRLGTFGRIADRGLTGYVPATVICRVSGSSNVSVYLRQRAGNQIATANGYTAVPCTGQPTTVNVRLDAHTVPLRRGAGLVDANVSVCSAYGPCLQASDRRNVFFL
jgi:hypothetical protein